MKNKKRNIIISIILILIVILTCYFSFRKGETLKTVTSKKQLEQLYKGERISEAKNFFLNIIGMPFSLLINGGHRGGYYPQYDFSGGMMNSGMTEDIIGSLDSNSSSTGSSPSKDYSTTNIQVENVDEADITKTDGDYIYSISESDVMITNVMNPEEIKIASRIISNDNSIPEDLILYEDSLVIIGTEKGTRYNEDNTVVKVYDIGDKEKPTLIKQYKLYEPYYTSRCIDNKLYVISSGKLRKENDEIVTYYREDYAEKEIPLDNIKYLEDVDTYKQTIISMLDLNKSQEDVKINSYLIDISNAYVSENSIYLLDQEYEWNYSVPPISSLFGPWGAIGPFKYETDDETGYHTKIYKFDISEDGTIKYSKNTKVRGKTINQYSIDEYEGNLRLAVYDNDGSKVIVLDKNLEKLGETSYLAKGEKMYSSRFMGDKAYLVTYKTIDPLYVIDLSNVNKPKVLGELKIPGYSTYLHPYDENHLIGIGMETEEVVFKDANGRVISTTSKIIGMKMALFDVSDVKNLVQISSTVIGDRRTTSAILTNPKALLFSKEKELIAIPVNNYAEDFGISNSSDLYSSTINSYTNYTKSYVSEGYAVYRINITEGFKLKGMITHERDDFKNNSYYYKTNSKLLRGLYIDENLYTVSENQVKVNNLDTLQLIDQMNLRTGLKIDKKDGDKTTNKEDIENGENKRDRDVSSNSITDSITNTTINEITSSSNVINERNEEE